MKKKIPLSLLEVFQPLIDKNKELVQQIKNDAVIFHLVDKDKDSDFFYQVVRQENSNGALGYIVSFQPRNTHLTIKNDSWLKLEEITASYEKWVGIIESYDKIHTIHDDPILKSNQERFEKQFNIVDEDAGYTAFNLDQQLFLNDYLNISKIKILELKQGKTEEQIKELDELENEATEIQKNLTKETKKEIIKRLSKFWGKAQKTGLDVIKEIFINVVADITKKLLTGN
jgi:hypothetical protein